MKVLPYIPGLQPSVLRSGYARLMVLFHCMVQHGTVQYGSLLGGFPLRTVPGTWYFLSGRGMKKPYVTLYIFCTLYIFGVCFLLIFLPLYLCFSSIKNNMIE